MGIAISQARTSVDRVVAALIAQIFTASDRSGSRQSKNIGIDSPSDRKRNTVTSASACAATSISSYESQNGFCPGDCSRISCRGLVWESLDLSICHYLDFMRDVCRNMSEGHFALWRYPKSSSTHVNCAHESYIRELRSRICMPDQFLGKSNILCEKDEIKIRITSHRLTFLWLDL